MSRYRIHHLRRFLIFIIVASTLVSSVATAAFFYRKILSILTEQSKADTLSRLAQVNESVRNQISSIDMTFPMFAANPTILGYIEPASETFGASATQKRLDIERQMIYLLINTYLWNERQIKDVYLFDSAGHYYSVSKKGAGAQELADNRALLKSTARNDPYLRLVPSGDSGDTIAFVRNIYSTNSGGYIATVMVDVDERILRETYSENLSEDMLVAVTDGDGTLLSSYGDSERIAAFLASSESERGDEWFYASSLLPRTDVHTYVALPHSSILAGLRSTLAAFIPLFAAIAAVVVLLALALSAFVTRPIQVMLSHVNEMSGGTAKEIPTGMYEEFNRLAVALNELLIRLEGYYQDFYEEELLLKNAQIKSLRAQINPHFLFNVLDTISWKAQINGDEEAAALTVSLGDLLRTGIMNEDQDEITLRQELENIRYYLHLQKARFEDRLLIDISVPEGILSCHVPRLSLQPLVENAIVHGLEGKTQTGHLVISACECAGTLELSVADDGVGFDSHALELPDHNRDRHTGIGVLNLRRRIALLYGDDYGLTVTSTPGEGTRAVMTLPKREENDV